MISWILRHTAGLLDWLLVFIFVAALVFACQLMINFYKEPSEPDDGDMQ